MKSSDSQKKNKRTLLVWDSDDTPPDSSWATVLWRSFSETDSNRIVSIPTMVEEQADTLRAQYLAWIYDLGETVISGKRIVDHLELRTGFSYWWLTSMAQKFNSSGISEVDNAIKCLALEKLLLECKSELIILSSGNKKLALTLKNYCKNSGIAFKWRLLKRNRKLDISKRQLFMSLPSPVRALISISKYLLKFFPLLFVKQSAVPALTGEIAFIDVLVHLDKKAFVTGKFISNYWTILIDKLQALNVKTNWIHNFFSHEKIASPLHAQKLINRFNERAEHLQTHFLIENKYSWSVCLTALRDYFRILKVSFKLNALSQYFKPAGSNLNLWPLFRQEWFDSLRGPEALHNCLRIGTYEKLFSSMMYQKCGVYIQENQPWEMALIYAWRTAGHGKLIGAPHTTVRFWDLRYFYDPRAYQGLLKNALPMPDVVAVNGSVAKRAYLIGGYPESSITEVEALRFFHLQNQAVSYQPIQTKRKFLSVLICGDFLTSTNYRILSWLEIAAKCLPSETKFVFKPHPACTVQVNDNASISINVTDAPLPELLMNSDVVFVSNITSAAVDAYCAGIPVVQMLDGRTLNMSPLRGLMGVQYVKDPKELARALFDCRSSERIFGKPYFFLDADLHRWQKLLQLRSHA